MTKRKDKKAPIKISAAAKQAEEDKLAKEKAESIEQEVVIEEAKASKNADEIVIEDAAQESEKASVDAADQDAIKEQAEANEEAEKGKKEDNSEKDNKKADKDKKDDKNKKAKKGKKEKKGLKRRTKETVSELKKVVWPKFPEVVKKTGIVIAFVVIFAVVLLGLDLLFGFISNTLMGNKFTPFQ